MTKITTYADLALQGDTSTNLEPMKAEIFFDQDDPVDIEYLRFSYLGKTGSGKTGIWSVSNSESDRNLGRIFWYSPWRKYTYQSGSHVIYDAKCLASISSVLDLLMKDHAARKKVAKDQDPAE